MKPFILTATLAAAAVLVPHTASAQDSARVFHCQAQCVSLNTACGSGIEGTVDGFSRRNARLAFSSMVAQCNSRAGGVGIVLGSIDGFRMESASHVVLDERDGYYRHHWHWHRYWSSRVVSWATSCNLEIYGTPARSGDDGICWQERVDEIDVPYTGDLPVRG